MKRKIWNILVWIDNNMSHWILDRLVIKGQSNDFSYWLWVHTAYAYCQWVNVYLYERWEIGP